jgi:spore coat protein U-like protein
MTRLLVAACCVLVHLSASAQFFQRPPRAVKPPAGQCGNRQAAVCQMNIQTFNFGRGEMSSQAPAINGTNTISVTCTRGFDQEGRDVQVDFYLRAQPNDPSRSMRDSHLLYLRYYLYVDPSRLRFWGTGESGTSAFQGTLFLNDRNRVGTLPFVVYGRVDGGQGQSPPGQWLGAVVTQLEYQVACQ